MKNRNRKRLIQRFRKQLLKNPILWQPEFCQCKQKRCKTTKISKQIFYLPICTKCKLKFQPIPSEQFYIAIYDEIEERKQDKIISLINEYGHDYNGTVFTRRQWVEDAIVWKDWV